MNSSKPSLYTKHPWAQTCALSVHASFISSTIYGVVNQSLFLELLDRRVQLSIYDGTINIELKRV